MTDFEKLQEIRRELLSKESHTIRKENVLHRLISGTYRKTGELWSLQIIPLEGYDIDFLKKTLKNLGYDATYEERYNDRFKKNCCIVRLSAKREQE